MGRVFSWLARRLLNPEVADFTCGFKAFRREVVDTLFTPLTLAGWAFDADLKMDGDVFAGVSILPLTAGINWHPVRTPKVDWGIGALASVIAPYPTFGEISKRVAGSYYTKSLFSERTRKIVRFLLRLG